MRSIAILRGTISDIKASKSGKTNEVYIISNEEGFKAYIPKEISLPNPGSMVEIVGNLRQKRNEETKQNFTYVILFLNNPTHYVREMIILEEEDPQFESE